MAGFENSRYLTKMSNFPRPGWMDGIPAYFRMKYKSPSVFAGYTHKVKVFH
jgi:hypothetical protein